MQKLLELLHCLAEEESRLADKHNQAFSELMLLADELSGRVRDDRQLSLVESMRRNLGADNLP
jgi:hypothetical protein